MSLTSRLPLPKQHLRCCSDVPRTRAIYLKIAPQSCELKRSGNFSRYFTFGIWPSLNCRPTLLTTWPAFSLKPAPSLIDRAEASSRAGCRQRLSGSGLHKPPPFSVAAKFRPLSSENNPDQRTLKGGLEDWPTNCKNRHLVRPQQLQ